MASFLSKLFGGGKSSDGGGAPQRGEAVPYEGFLIHAAPERAGDQWRLAGVIVKQGAGEAGGDLERVFVRADNFASRDECESYAIRKGKQIIDEQGDRLFADGAPTGRA
jgi:hypothetical protein